MVGGATGCNSPGNSKKVIGIIRNASSSAFPSPHTRAPLIAGKMGSFKLQELKQNKSHLEQVNNLRLVFDILEKNTAGHTRTGLLVI